MKTFKPATPAHALIAAIHAVRPPVLANGVVVDMEKPRHLETVNVTFALTPELVKAWGVECAKLGVESGPAQKEVQMGQGACSLVARLEAMESGLATALAQIAKNTACTARSLEVAHAMRAD